MIHDKFKSALLQRYTFNTELLVNNKMGNKTWSSVSNSSLSETFALGSLQSINFRTSVLFLQKTLFWVRKNLSVKKFWFPENFWA